jgi:arsenical pump membrane protein
LNDLAVLAVAGTTFLLVLARPRGVSEGVWALGGGLLLVAGGALPAATALATIRDLAGVALFLAGLFWLSLAASRAGLIDLLSDQVVRRSAADGRLLMVAVFALGTAVTALLSNDATVVLVTPVVIQLCRRLEIAPLPYAFAVTFVADSASSLAPVANPVNILFAEQLDLEFARHVLFLALPTLVGLAVTLVMLLIVMRDQIPRSLPDWEGDGGDWRRLDLPGRLVAACLLLTGLGYAASAVAGFDPYWVTLAGGLAAVLPGLYWGRLVVADLARVQPPSLYAFVAGLALVVSAVEREGLLDRLGSLVASVQDRPEAFGIVGLGVGAALGTNLVNNWTMALILIPPLEQGNASEGQIFAALLGTDIGPNLTIVGSLATLIWMTQIRDAGLAVSARTYLRLGVITTLPALAASMLTLVALSALI